MRFEFDFQCWPGKRERERESFPSMEGSVTNVHSHNNVLLSKLETCQYHYHIRNWEHRASEGKGGKK